MIVVLARRCLGLGRCTVLLLTLAVWRLPLRPSWALARVRMLLLALRRGSRRRPGLPLRALPLLLLRRRRGVLRGRYCTLLWARLRRRPTLRRASYVRRAARSRPVLFAVPPFGLAETHRRCTRP